MVSRLHMPMGILAIGLLAAHPAAARVRVEGAPACVDAAMVQEALGNRLGPAVSRSIDVSVGIREVAGWDVYVAWAPAGRWPLLPGQPLLHVAEDECDEVPDQIAAFVVADGFDDGRPLPGRLWFPAEESLGVALVSPSGTAQMRARGSAAGSLGGGAVRPDLVLGAEAGLQDRFSAGINRMATIRATALLAGGGVRIRPDALLPVEGTVNLGAAWTHLEASSPIESMASNSFLRPRVAASVAAGWRRSPLVLSLAAELRLPVVLVDETDDILWSEGGLWGGVELGWTNAWRNSGSKSTGAAISPVRSP